MSHDSRFTVLDEYEANLRARGRSPHTISTYLYALTHLSAWHDGGLTIAFSGTSAVSPAPVTVPAGESTTLTFDLPFGTTDVTVQANGATLATAPITFLAPTTTLSPTTTLVPASTLAPKPPTPGATPPATGSGPGSGDTALIALAFVAVGTALAFGVARRRGDTH